LAAVPVAVPVRSPPTLVLALWEAAPCTSSVIVGVRETSSKRRRRRKQFYLLTAPAVLASSPSTTSGYYKVGVRQASTTANVNREPLSLFLLPSPSRDSCDQDLLSLFHRRYSTKEQRGELQGGTAEKKDRCRQRGRGEQLGNNSVSFFGNDGIEGKRVR
jgi:hypothetical protein